MCVFKYESMWNLFVQQGLWENPTFYELKTAFSETEDYFQWLIIAQYSMLNLHFLVSGWDWSPLSVFLKGITAGEIQSEIKSFDFSRH